MGHSEEGGGKKKLWVSLILLVSVMRVTVFKNRSGIRPFTSNVRGDYTLIEVI